MAHTFVVPTAPSPWCLRDRPPPAGPVLALQDSAGSRGTQPFAAWCRARSDPSTPATAPPELGPTRNAPQSGRQHGGIVHIALLGYRRGRPSPRRRTLDVSHA